jgi:hypothetical protein
MNTTPYMDKQIMDLSQGSAATQSKDFIDLMNHPEEEEEEVDHHHGHTHQIGGVNKNGINQKEEIVASYDFQPIRPLYQPPNFDASPNLQARAWSSGSDSKPTTTTTPIRVTLSLSLSLKFRVSIWLLHRVYDFLFFYFF